MFPLDSKSFLFSRQDRDDLVGDGGAGLDAGLLRVPFAANSVHGEADDPRVPEML